MLSGGALAAALARQGAGSTLPALAAAACRGLAALGAAAASPEARGYVRPALASTSSDEEGAASRQRASGSGARPSAAPHATAVPEVWGQIHSTESFSAVDGPGVRFIVFLQGCAMRCLFCSNPDTWSAHAGEHVSSKDLAVQLRRVAPYLRPHGGGVTLSGGEPLLQPDFAAAILREAHSLDLTTCLDTTGQGTKHHNWDVVLPHTDMALFCIKSLDPAKYTKLTGLRLAGALRFAGELGERGIPYWTRYVLIPGLTDSEADLDKLAAWAGQQPSMQGVELLPYHLLGRNKWEALNLRYPLEGVPTPAPAAVRNAIARLEERGVRVICEVGHDKGEPDAHHAAAHS